MRKSPLHNLPPKSLRTLFLLLLLLPSAFCFERKGAAVGLQLSGQQTAAAQDGASVWLVVKAYERRLELAGNYHYRMDGAGRVNFKDGGRVIEYPEGLTVLVNDEKVKTGRRVQEGENVRLVNGKGETIWKLSPVPPDEMFW